MQGFMGTILEVDLTKKTITKNPLNLTITKQFLGGAGYACATLYPLLSKEIDPLGPNNKLMFMTGPLTGTIATSTGRMVCCAKSPLTGVWGEANSGSDVCVQLKRAGYDGILFHGAASTPVYLEIADDKVELKDASDLWGKNIYETTEILKNRVKETLPRARVIAIGPAGEHLVKFAIIGSEERAFGRTGMGAVMGSKKLKALVIQGTKTVSLAQPEKFKEKVQQTNKELMEIFTNQMFQELGTSGGLDMYGVTGELPIKYFRGSNFPESANISGSTLAEQFMKKNRHCFACPIGCGRVVSVGENTEGFPPNEFEGPEYETLAGFGSMILNGDLRQILKANYICNDLGLDTISSSGNIALLMDLMEQQKVSAADLDGISLTWGNMEAVKELLQKIAHREGIGNIIAEGPKGIIDRFQIDPDQVAAIHNAHVTYHDMRASFPMALAYGISPHYGGSHNSCDAYMATTGLEIPEMGIDVIAPHLNTPEAAQMAAKLMAYRAFYSSVIMCVFANPPTSAVASYLELALGEPFSLSRIKELGERILDLKRLFNLKMGHTPQDEHIPKILLIPLPQSGQEGHVPDVDLLYREFYTYLDWDRQTGRPSQKKLEELGLTIY